MDKAAQIRQQVKLLETVQLSYMLINKFVGKLKLFSPTQNIPCYQHLNNSHQVGGLEHLLEEPIEIMCSLSSQPVEPEQTEWAERNWGTMMLEMLCVLPGFYVMCIMYSDVFICVNVA